MNSWNPASLGLLIALSLSGCGDDQPRPSPAQEPTQLHQETTIEREGRLAAEKAWAAEHEHPYDPNTFSLTLVALDYLDKQGFRPLNVHRKRLENGFALVVIDPPTSYIDYHPNLNFPMSTWRNGIHWVKPNFGNYVAAIIDDDGVSYDMLDDRWKELLP